MKLTSEYAMMQKIHGSVEIELSRLLRGGSFVGSLVLLELRRFFVLGAFDRGDLDRVPAHV